MKKSIVVALVSVALLVCNLLPLVRANAENALITDEKTQLTGEYCVYTNAPSLSQTWIVDPVLVSIAGEPFLKGNSVDGTDSTRLD